MSSENLIPILVQHLDSPFSWSSGQLYLLVQRCWSTSATPYLRSRSWVVLSCCWLHCISGRSNSVIHRGVGLGSLEDHQDHGPNHCLSIMIYDCLRIRRFYMFVYMCLFYFRVLGCLRICKWILHMTSSYDMYVTACVDQSTETVWNKKPIETLSNSFRGIGDRWMLWRINQIWRRPWIGWNVINVMPHEYHYQTIWTTGFFQQKGSKSPRCGTRLGPQ